MKKRKKQRKLIRLSNLLLDSLKKLNGSRLKQIQTVMDEFNEKCLETIKDKHLFDTAVEKNWLIGAESIRSRIERNLNDFSQHLQRFKELINSDEAVTPNLIDIFKELLQIEQEFGKLNINFKEKTISVMTEDIVLDDTSLGPFEIRLFINQLAKLYEDSPYRVIAIESNPAGNNSEVTHPHVSGERLCEGDGHVAIRAALEQGRFNDFFMLIISILRTYNPDSAYISLEDWEGRGCYDCGDTISQDECYYCEKCDREFCPQCSTYCRVCETTVCLGCSSECQECHEPVCVDCMNTCVDCEEKYCKNCLNEEGLCKNCELERKENENEELHSEKADAEV
ncbi:MAG: hypothetical protein A2Y10_16470 [Planctomycetes bacterium GWF2_41_51]|nr:MAG: hypothetical protein A2Y10_16470 [Planctomycetes bacterium GWF2_41_51]HBG27915.1 hypothetical protein [Phycisphaerales bacterium]